MRNGKSVLVLFVRVHPLLTGDAVIVRLGLEAWSASKIFAEWVECLHRLLICGVFG